MALRLILLTFLVVAMVAIPTGDAQLGGLGGLGGLISGLLGVQGVVRCVMDSNNIGSINGQTLPVFPNAGVQLQCGNGKVLSTTTTNEGGAFAFVLTPLASVLASLVNDCKLVVTTPLSACNASLPSVGGLQSLLDYRGSTILGLLKILNFSPIGFLFNPTLNT